jgi:TPR repeat protein
MSGKPRLILFAILGAIVAVIVVLVAKSAAAGVEEGRQAFLRSDYKAAWAELTPLARAGAPEASYLVGVMYAHGAGVAQDRAQAATHYRVAAERGHVAAQFSLGFLLHQDGDDAGAAPWLLKAAEGGVPFAQHLVAGLYAAGRGLPQSAVEANRWTLIAAERGVVGAQYDAGLLFARCPGPECRRVEAYKWFALAARAGYPGAAENRALMAAAMHGSEVEAAERAAASWRPAR